jgi:hypothetical protein
MLKFKLNESKNDDKYGIETILKNLKNFEVIIDLTGTLWYDNE